LGDYKDYLFVNDIPEAVDNPITPTIVNGITFHDGLAESQIFDLLVALVAAEEGAHIISESIRRAALAEPYPVVPTPIVDVAGEPVAIPAPKQKIWISKKFDAGTSVSKTITGGRQMLELFGPGKVIDAILIADVSTIGMQITVDGDIMYDGNYTALGELTKADSRLSVYDDPLTSKYVILVAGLGFRDQFIFVPTCTGTVEFDTIRVNYELLVEI